MTMPTTYSRQQPVPRPTGPVTPKIAAVELMQGGKEAVIVHGTAEYRLRITATGKLILTK